jgi:hypothetical protein
MQFQYYHNPIQCQCKAVDQETGHTYIIGSCYSVQPIDIIDGEPYPSVVDGDVPISRAEYIHITGLSESHHTLTK